MIRILKTRMFCQWMKKTPLKDKDLCKAIEEMMRGMVDADLGAHLYKKRVAFPGRGKRGSARTLIATNNSNRWIFLFGFEKNDKENISPAELSYLQMLAQDLLEYSDLLLDSAIVQGKIQEVN